MTTRAQRQLLCAALAAGLACSSGDDGATGVPLALPSPAVREAPAAPPEPNRPPRIASLRLVPDAPRAGERVNVAVVAHDPEGQVLRTRTRWTIEGRANEVDARELVVPEGSRGRMIRATVVVDDGHGGEDTASATTPVSNSPPVVGSVSLDPREPTVESDLVASPRSTDRDGDRVDYRYRWLVNGRPVPGDGPVLPRDRFRRGDSIALEVTAFDGIDASLPMRSDAVLVGNAPPRIVSSPEEIVGERSVTARLRAEDPDGDRSLRFALVQGPQGLDLDPVTGELHWSPRPDQAGAHRVTIAVADAGGARSSQTIVLRVGPSPPPAAHP